MGGHHTWVMMAAEAAASKIKEYIENEATEPMTLSQMIVRGVCSTPQSMEEESALLRLLESGLTHKDISIGGGTNVRLYWRKKQSRRQSYLDSKSSVSERSTSYMLVSQPPSVQSRRQFISPARREGRYHIQKTALSCTPVRRHPVPGVNLNRTSVYTGIGGFQDADALTTDVLKLKETVAKVESEVGSMAEEYSEVELQQHIDKLHEYNEVKDIGQLLLGKLAEVEGTTTASLYQRFGLELDN